MIRHKASGEFMPLMKRGKGYSHWNPVAQTEKIIATTNIPRFLPSLRMSRRVCSMWVTMPNAYMGYSTNYNGDENYDLKWKDDGRKIEDLEIVTVNIEEVEVIPSQSHAKG